MTATIGTTRPAAPNERTNGTGTMNNVARPMATVQPDNTTVRPALDMVARIAASTDTPSTLTSRQNRCTIKSE